MIQLSYKKSSTADNGQIAVILIDNEEATLKRIRKKEIPSHLKVLIENTAQKYILQKELRSKVNWFLYIETSIKIV